jgi:CDP-diacylglycerol--glycerol-3-phosphate 3-phosphatidyltransferase
MLVAGLLVLFGGYFDMIDGSLARRIGKVTLFGVGIGFYFRPFIGGCTAARSVILVCRRRAVVGIMLVGITLLASLVVSYIRARAEVIGVECLEGLFTRPERVIVMAIAY